MKLFFPPSQPHIKQQVVLCENSRLSVSLQYSHRNDLVIHVTELVLKQQVKVVLATYL